MKNLAVSGALQKKISMAGLKLKKYSPEILLIGGVVGVVATIVLACRATTKVGDALSEVAETSEKINGVFQCPAVKMNAHICRGIKAQQCRLVSLQISGNLIIHICVIE